jgi:hypothetical protein
VKGRQGRAVVAGSSLNFPYARAYGKFEQLPATTAPAPGGADSAAATRDIAAETEPLANGKPGTRTPEREVCVTACSSNLSENTPENCDVVADRNRAVTASALPDPGPVLPFRHLAASGQGGSPAVLPPTGNAGEQAAGNPRRAVELAAYGVQAVTPGRCRSCGDNFVHARRDARYCSTACRMRAYRARLREAGR